jgi:hypothetical protein
MYNAKQIAWTAGIALVVVVAFQHYQAKSGSATGARSSMRLAG